MAILSQAPDSLKPTGKRVLIVDDEILVARACARTLESEGFDTRICHNASEAFAQLGQEDFQAVVSDIAMPMLNGIELLRTIRSQDQDLPVILITGGPDLETALQAMEYGAFRYLIKPVSREDLVRAVRNAINLYRLAGLKRHAMDALGTGAGEGSGRAGLEASFNRAVQSIWPAYQPILRVSDRSLFGYEALLRSDESTLPHPGAILDAAERLGQLDLIGRTMRDRACAVLDGDDNDFSLFINLHPADLADPSLLDPEAKHMIYAERIVLEVTERSALDGVKGARLKVRALRDAGFRIAVDDLGAGYAGLSSFVELEPDLVKLDMSLVRDVDTSRLKQRLVRSMTEVCNDMGLGVVGEGVETEAERDTLIDLGCDFLQGYLFGRPARQLAPASW